LACFFDVIKGYSESGGEVEKVRRLLVVCEQAAWNTVNSDAAPESDQSSDQIRKTKWKKQFLKKPHKALIYKEEPW